MTTNANEREHINSVDSVRAIAALMIVLFHLPKIVNLRLPDELAFISSHFGLGVPLFYAVSGFALAHGYDGKLTHARAILAFYIRRLFRIAPLFYAMLIVYIVIFHTPISWRSLILNVSFLFGLAPGHHESLVWAGWSIGIEMLFYLAFPLVIASTQRGLSVTLWMLATTTVSIAVFRSMQDAGMGSYAYMNLVTHLPFFISGVIAHRVGPKLARVGQRGALVFITLAVLTALALSRLSAPPVQAWSAVFFFLLLSASFGTESVLNIGLLQKIGTMSFSLYLLHPLLMLGLHRIGFATAVESIFPDTVAAFVVGAGIFVALLCAASYISYRLIESPGIELGRLLADRVRLGTKCSSLRLT